MSEVVRDSRWIDREYGQEKWPAILEQIESSSLDADKLVHTLSIGSSASMPVRFDGSVLSLPYRLALSGYLGWIAGCVADYAKSSELVVELGAGWGRNLVLSWLHGANPRARYVAAEYTVAGRKAASSLAARCRGIDMRSIAFDYNHPTLSQLGTVKSATLFTVHSIEQIPQVDDRLVDAVRSVAREVVVLHFEPVGWQVRGDSSSEYAERHDYNRNLYTMLRAAGVEMIEVEVDVIGLNPDNPTSKIVWR